MIYDVNGRMVEVDGKMFPAANIQVWREYPNLHWSKDHGVFYGVYFEVMFEDGDNLTVSQEMAEEAANFFPTGSCYELSHFLVVITNKRDGYKEVIHAWHCVDEQKLAEIIQLEIDIHKDPKGVRWYTNRMLANSFTSEGMS